MGVSMANRASKIKMVDRCERSLLENAPDVRSKQNKIQVCAVRSDRNIYKDSPLP